MSLQTAVYYAMEAHQKQTRKDPWHLPYIVHPIDAMNILIKSGVTCQKTLSAAVLHDTLEDTETTMDDLIRIFGPEIASIVSECTDNKDHDKVTRKKQQIVHAHHMSQKAAFVKVADKLSNLEYLLAAPPPKWSPEITRGYIAWSKAVLDNLLPRLGSFQDPTVQILTLKVENLYKQFQMVGLDLGLGLDLERDYYALLQ